MNDSQNEGRKEPRIDEATQKKIQDLKEELGGVGESCKHSSQWLQDEIARLQRGEKDKPRYVDVVTPKPIKLSEKIYIPYREHPKVNYVGKLLGPKGMSLKKLQEDTGCKMAILGKGSMRDKSKEEELRNEGGKYAHLNEDLHVLVDVYATAAEAHQRLSHAMSELKKYLSPDYEEVIRAEQYETMLQVDPASAPLPGTPGHPAVGMRGRGAPRGGFGRGGGGRGGPMGAGGGGPPSRGGMGASRGGMSGPGMGGPSPRGGYGGARGAPARGGMDRGGMDRGGYGGAGASGGMDRGGYAGRSESYDDGYGDEGHMSRSTGGRYDQGAGGGYGPPSNSDRRAPPQDTYSTADQYDPFNQDTSGVESYDYGHGSSSGGGGGGVGASSGGYRTTGMTTYAEESYGNGDSWSSGRPGGGMKAPPTRGGMGAGRSAPYGSRPTRF